jgi:hypothetical protein
VRKHKKTGKENKKTSKEVQKTKAKGCRKYIEGA